MGSLPILLPPKRLQLQFAEVAPENNEFKVNIMKQNEALARARDLLLPRLMNGQIAV